MTPTAGQLPGRDYLVAGSAAGAGAEV
ncbi:MAG: hypothetical protein AVDCRST_MAG66-3692, partial [uncultured Pseudonocardia sp.]